MDVEFFDSLEEAQARLREAMEAADGRVRPWQAAVKVGDCFIADGGEEDLVVFGEVLEGYQEAHLRHYRFCRCFSVACPEGEVGDVHVSTVLCLVSREFFEAMRREGWQMEGGSGPLRLPDGRGRGVVQPARSIQRDILAGFSLMYTYPPEVRDDGVGCEGDAVVNRSAAGMACRDLRDGPNA